MGERYNGAKVALLTTMGMRVYGSPDLDWENSEYNGQLKEYVAPESKEQSDERWKKNAAFLAAIQAATSDKFDVQFNSSETPDDASRE